MPRPTPRVAFVGDRIARENADVWAGGSVTVPEAAEYYRIGRTTLYALMGSGEIVWSQPTRHRLIARRSIELYLARNQKGGAA